MEERILFYAASFFKIDGVTLTLRGLISHTVKRGVRVCILTADDPADQAVDAFVQSHPVGAVSVLRATGGLVPAPGSDYYMGLHVGKDTREAVQDYNPSVVHITNPDLVALWLTNWVQQERADTVLIATLHTNFMDIANYYCVAGRTQALWATSAFLRHVYSLCPAVYAPTEFMRKKLEEERWDTKLGVWGRGVDPDLFSPARKSQDLRRQMLGVGPNDLAVLWLGRVVQEKQPGVWLKALQTVQAEAQERYDAAVSKGQNPLPGKIVGVCVGQGEAMDMLKGAEGVVCVGWKAGEELARVVASCDVMVAPSEIETFGRVTLEAMSCGLACVVNRECGSHLVTDGENGFSVPSTDREGYVVGLRRLIEDNDLRHRMSAKGREMALGYSTAEVYNGMLEIYRSSRDEQRRQFRDRKAQKTEKKEWPFWEAFGLVIYYFFELAKLVTALIALATKGPDSEVVRLSVKAYRKHLTLLGGLLGLNSFHAGVAGGMTRLERGAGEGGLRVSKATASNAFGQRCFVLIVITILVAIVSAVTVVTGGAAVKLM